MSARARRLSVDRKYTPATSSHSAFHHNATECQLRCPSARHTALIFTRCVAAHNTVRHSQRYDTGRTFSCLHLGLHTREAGVCARAYTHTHTHTHTHTRTCIHLSATHPCKNISTSSRMSMSKAQQQMLQLIDHSLVRVCACARARTHITHL